MLLPVRFLTKRFFNTSPVTCAVVQKELLSQLRNKTGLPFTHCKKALELHENDLLQSENWLKEQAQKEGWAKVAKVQHRTVLQGLVGLIVDRNFGVMIEVNCESDFVARNAKFINMVETLTRNCYHQFNATGLNDQEFKMWSCRNSELNKLPLLENESKTFADLIAVNVGLLGENMMLRRAVFCKVADNCILSNYAHSTGNPMVPISGFVAGKYGSLVAFKTYGSHDPEYSLTIDDIGTKLCQQIVGMNPKTITKPEKENEAINSKMITNSNQENPTMEKEPELIDSKMVSEPNKENSIEEEESALMHQEFIADPDLTVGEFLKKCNVSVLGFARYQCGELLEEKTD